MAMDQEFSEGESASLPLDRPGDILRRAREAKKLSIEAVAEATRIPIRQLQAVERNDFASLPGTPYAVGFARAYARAVGADEVEIARGVRIELGTVGPGERYEMFEPVDPARVPPRWLAWTAAGIALLLAIGYGVWRAHFFSDPNEAQPAQAVTVAQSNVAPGMSAPTPSVPRLDTGPVVLTALQDVWLRIYDQNGERLLEKQMAKGESYTVPRDAANPMILTGRPDALGVTVGGKAVPPLGPPERTIADVPISAAALLARPAPLQPANLVRLPAPGSRTATPPGNTVSNGVAASTID